VGARPTGTVTFLFTDLEGSTRLWGEHAADMEPALARHDAILREAVAAHEGWVFASSGDGLAAAFSTAPDAVTAAAMDDDEAVDLVRNEVDRLLENSTPAETGT